MSYVNKLIYAYVDIYIFLLTDVFWYFEEDDELLISLRYILAERWAKLYGPLALKFECPNCQQFFTHKSSCKRHIKFRCKKIQTM